MTTENLMARREARNWAHEKLEAVLDALDKLRDEFNFRPTGFASTDAAIACHASYGALFATDALAGEIASIREEREG